MISVAWHLIATARLLISRNHIHIYILCSYIWRICIFTQFPLAGKKNSAPTRGNYVSKTVKMQTYLAQYIVGEEQLHT